mgnify:CR=1 FL=1
MNLVIDPWIPIVTTEGKTEDVSLMRVFTDGKQYADLSVRPHERVALMRLFICIAQAALDGPKDEADRKTAFTSLSGMAKIYLDKWKSSFELFDRKQPFLQIADLKSNELTPISKLDLFLATGNNTTLFDHGANGTGNRTINISKIPLLLLTFQCFSPGGGLPVVTWKNKKTGQVGNPDSLCITGGMYHTFIRGTNILETIYLNLLPKALIARHYGTVNKEGFWGKPMWEMFPEKPDDEEKIKNATQTYLGRLVPMCRWIKIELNNSGIHCGKGFDYSVMDRKIKRPKKNQNKLPVWPAEPTASVVMNREKTERYVLGAKPDKAIWRELAALLVARNEDSVGGPLALQNHLPASFDIHVCALIRHQATIESMVESVYAVSNTILTEEGRALYVKGVERAEWQSVTLGYAVEEYRRNIDRFWDRRVEQAGKERKAIKAKLYSMAMRSYWTAVEKQRHLLMAHVDAYGTDQLAPTGEEWRKVLHKAARDAYIASCGHDTSRQIRAFVLGWKKLFAEKKAEAEIEEQDTDGGEECAEV